MANPFPFVAGAVLTAAQLNGIGEAGTSFTPTMTNYTRGNGTSVAYYIRINKLVYVYIKETLGSTSSVTGGILIDLPIAAVRTQAIQMGRARIDDAGTNTYMGTTYAASATQTILFADLASGTYTAFAGITSTVPMTWANTDSFQFAFVYEAA